MNFTTTYPNKKMTDFSWSEFLAGSAVAKVVEEVVKYRRRKLETTVNMADNAKDIADVHRIMESIVRETYFDRFMVFVGQDSAGVLAAGKNLYITAQYEKISSENEALKPIQDDIQRWKADTQYYDVFSEMLTKGKVTVKTADMPDSKLKDIYLAQGVKVAKIFHLMTTKDSSMVFFCSVASTVVDEAKADDRFLIESAVDKLTNIFQKHRKFY